MRTHLAPLVLVALFPLAMGACKALTSPPPEELDLWSDSAAGVQHPALARLCGEVWQADLRWDPFQATYLGDPRYLADVPRRSQQARGARREELEHLRLRTRAIADADLTPADRLTRELMMTQIDRDLARLSLNLEDWVVDPLEGPQIRILNVSRVQPYATAREREQLLARWKAFPSYVRQAGENLRYGKRAGRTSSATAIAKNVEQLEAILNTDPMDSPLVEIATGGGEWVALPPRGSVSEIAHSRLGDARYQGELRRINLHLQEADRVAFGTRVLLPAADDPLSPEERGLFLAGALTAVEKQLYPALAGYRDILRDEILLTARSDERAGLVHLPRGLDMYRTLIHEHTTLPLEECDAQAIHEFGLAEVARIRGEIADLGERVFGTRDVAAIQTRLRTDPELHFTSRDEVEGKAVDALFLARQSMEEYFGILPEADCEVVRISPYEERDTTIAYYREPAADGSRPGRYYINTFEPQTRPRYEAEVLAYHEAIPGHHLQIAIAQELTELPLFRRHGGSTAFIEGWALYTERLCDEMELYSGDMDRFGVLSFDAWRASRLVVDTGIHAFGWSRDKAIEYLYANTLLALNNCENEVDRYIAWPGQALAYKIGQREILELRAQAREVQGAAFSHRQFHDRVLENGAVTLDALRGIVGRWLEEADEAEELEP